MWWEQRRVTQRIAAKERTRLLIWRANQELGGKPLPVERVSQVVAGKTTEAEMIALFGNPTSRGMNVDGQPVMAWIYTKAKQKSLNKTDLQQQVISVALDSNRKVSRIELFDTVTK